MPNFEQYKPVFPCTVHMASMGRMDTRYRVSVGFNGPRLGTDEVYVFDTERNALRWALLENEVASWHRTPNVHADERAAVEVLAADARRTLEEHGRRLELWRVLFR